MPLKNPKQILPAISAIFLIFTYPSFNLEFFAWFSLIPLFFSLEGKNIRQRFFDGYIFGIVFFSGALYWLFRISIPGAIGLILLLSLAPVIFCSIYQPDGRYKVYSLLYVPSAWIFTEYLRTHLFTGFPWILLGHSQSLNIDVIQIANITGAYGVSFIVIFANFGLYLVLRKASRRFYILLLVFAVIAASLAYGKIAMRQSSIVDTLKVSVIQGNIPQAMKWNPKYRDYIMQQYIRTSRDAIAETKPNLVIWPETSLPGYIEEKDLRNAVSTLARSEKTYLLIGTLHGEGENAFNSACLISDNGSEIDRYDKIHLVPFGEYLPFEDKIRWIRSLIDKPMGDFVRGRDYTVFEFRPEEKTYRFSCLSCYEDIFPDISRRFVKKGAQFLVNLTNDAWFGKTCAPYQHLQGSIFRAVENRVPVLRAANTGVSCIIDSRGRITEIVKKGKDEIFIDGYKTGYISIGRPGAFYTRFGDVFAWGCVIFVILKIMVNIRRKTV